MPKVVLDCAPITTDHLRKRVVNEVGIAWVVEGGDELCGQADALVELSQE